MGIKEATICWGKSMKTKYIMVKRCLNCGCNNSPVKNSCTNCHLLLVDEINYEEWTNINHKKAEASEYK